MKYSNKKGFTLIELIICVVIISMGFFGVIAAVKAGINFMEKTRKEVIAINMARSGMEIVYNIRDTNRNRRTSQVEKCWLKIDPMNDGGDGCEDDAWFNTGNYIPLIGQSSGQKYFLLSGINNDLNLKDDMDSSDYAYTMCLSGGTWQNCHGIIATGDSIKEGKFFRQIKGLGLQDKENNSILNCVNGNNLNCGDEKAKEFRFCSRVEYLYGGGDIGNVEFCGILTNFYQY